MMIAVEPWITQIGGSSWRGLGLKAENGSDCCDPLRSSRSGLPGMPSRDA
jgi:hypothetical protein